MIDGDALAAMPSGPQTKLAIEKLDLEGLLELKCRIEAMLPPTKLAELDLEGEVVMQYHRAKALMTTVVADEATPANQKAQVANSCASVLDQLIKMQTRLYSAERVKALEAALIKALKTLPSETQALFIETYEKIYATSQAATEAGKR